MNCLPQFIEKFKRETNIETTKRVCISGKFILGKCSFKMCVCVASKLYMNNEQAIIINGPRLRSLKLAVKFKIIQFFVTLM